LAHRKWKSGAVYTENENDIKNVAHLMIYLVALLFFIAPATAMAEPVSATLAATAFFTSLSAATGIAATTLASVATFASLTAASVGLNLLFAGKRSKVRPQDLKNTTKGSEGPGIHAFGRVELGGTVIFGNTKSYSIYRLLAHCFGPLNGIEDYIYDGRDIILDANGNVLSPPWVKSGGSYMNLKVQAGDGTETAYSDLVTDFPGIWTSNHKVQGLFQTLLKVTNPGTGNSKFAKLLNGGIKELKLVCRVGSFYDPRTTLSAWSLNSVLHCLHYLRLLPGSDDSNIDLAGIGAIATQSEVLVPTLTGTAPRSQLSGGWKGPITSDIVEDMLASAGLEINSTAEGKYTFAFIEDDPAIEITLTSKHIIDRDYKSGPEGAQRPNICKLEYFSPERRYEMAEIDLTGAAWAKVQGEIDRYGEQELRVQLPFCTDASQAQRIARRLFHMERADFGTIITNFTGMALWGLRTASIEFPDVGVDGASVFKKCALGTVRVNDAEGTCEIPFQVIPGILTIPWNAAADEQPAPPVLLVGQFGSELDDPVAPSRAITVTYPDASFEVRTEFSAVATAVSAEAVYRGYTNGQPDPWQSMAEAQLVFARDGANLIGKQADFRVRFENSGGDSSHFSPSLSVTDVPVDNSVLAAPVQNVTINGFNFDVAVTTSSDLQIAHSEVQYRIYTGTPSGAWLIDDTRNARPFDAYTHVLSVDSSTGLSIGETLAIRTVTFTSDGTSTASTEYTFLKI
jgi:Putative phage tail protein